MGTTNYTQEDFIKDLEEMGFTIKIIKPKPSIFERICRAINANQWNKRERRIAT